MEAALPRKRLLRLDLPQAVLLALLLHVVLFMGGQVFPGLVAPWTAAVPDRPPEPAPLRFEFVDLPQEPPEPEVAPENAPASDRTRQVSTPRPPEPVPESADPFSQGDTSQKVAFNPGIESPPVAPQVPQPETPPPTPEPEPEPTPATAEPEITEGPGAEPPAEAEPIEESPQEPVDEPKPVAEQASKAQALMDSLRRPVAPQDAGQLYDNLAAPAQADFGAISFDTVGVDWGPYAKQITQIIRRHWIERIPPAAKMGIAGRSVIEFRIAKNGIVTAIAIKDGSGTRPLDKAAEYAIEAASPLPPLPAAFHDLGKEDVGVSFEFYYNMRVPSRR